jgi:hypothetical protein
MIKTEVLGMQKIIIKPLYKIQVVAAAVNL